MLPTISIGPLVLPTTGLVYILGAWLVLTVVERAAKFTGASVQPTYGVAFVGMLAGFIGARLLFVATHWSAYVDNPLSIIWPLSSGFSPAGGLLVGGVAALYYARWQRLPLGRTLDALLPGVIVGFMVVSLADFLGGPGYGQETTLLWGIDLFGIRRHPVQIYELLAGLVALAAWYFLARNRIRPGRAFLLGTAVYAAGRLLLDAFRANAPLTTGGFHIIQIISLVIMLTCLVFLAFDTPPETAETAE
jgi:phosphatidylglycerol:prolipoprotein diacylglycerol transferase